jgi:hypothetical protein
MKQLFAFILAAGLFLSSYAQEETVHYKVVTFMTNQSFYLNGGARAAFGGKSRTYLYFTLPTNTIEWYYAITTTPNENQNVSIGLANQLMKVVDPTGGIASTALSSLITPTGSGACDIYLLTDQQVLNKFISKEYQTPAYIMSGTRENFKQGVIPIRDAVRGTYYLAFRNPSGSQGINVNVEIAAIVAEKGVKSESQQKAELYGSLGWKAYQSGDLDKCLELSKKALTFDGSLCWVQCNVALVYLVTGKPEATDEYIKAIELVKQSKHAKEYLTGAIKDIDDAKQTKGTIKDADLVRSLLMDEYRRYGVANR